MGRVRFLLAAVAAGLVVGLSTLSGQDIGGQPFQPPHRHIPVFGGADEFALAGDLEYYIPLDRVHRDIDVQVATITVAAHMRHGWEFQFDVLALRAHGFRNAPSGDQYPQIPSNAAALGGGPLARWNFLQFSRFRPFVEAEGDFILFDRPWPTGGTIDDFFLRAGGGVSVRVSDAYWIESSFHYAHISNGSGGGLAGNPTWQGKGIAVSLRRSFTHQPEGKNKPGHWPFRDAAENAWITNIEDYTPVPGLNRKNGTVQAEMRELRISRAWHFRDHLEFQLGGMVQTTNAVFGFGPVLRWNFLERTRWRLFLDGGADVLQVGSPAYIIPWKGDGYNFFPRGRIGASFQLHDSYWLEAAFGGAYVTPRLGGCCGGQLSAWGGQGASLGLRYTFRGRQSF